MITEKIDLYEFFRIARGEHAAGYLELYVGTPMEEIAPRIRPGMLVIPGGGYGMISQREAEPVALRFADHGFAAAVLRYSTNTAYPVPLLEACMATVWLRENAKRLYLNPDNLAAIGFSAGGHLAGMLGTLQEGELSEFLGEKMQLARPDAIILSYAVLTMGISTHGGTRDIITGRDPALREKLSVEKRVNEKSAPAFLWHTTEDGCVPVENSMLLAAAYRKAGIPFALHLFERGRHGLSVVNAETNVEGDEAYFRVRKWVGLSLDWLSLHGFDCQK